MRGRIYYFTGTGNSMRAARVISGRLKDTEIVSMRSDPKDYPATDCICNCNAQFYMRICV